MTPHRNEINDHTPVKFNSIGHLWVFVTGIIGYTIAGVVMYFSMIEKIKESATENTRPLRQAVELLQTEVRFQGQYVWSLDENAKLKEMRNDAISEQFRQFASDQGQGIIFRDDKTGLYKFKY